VVAAVVATIVAGAAAATPLPSPVSALQILAFAASAGALLAGGGRDPRARTLAAVFLVIASSFALRPLHALAAEGRDGSALALLARLQVDAFLPLLLWRFFRAFPRAAETPAVAAVGRIGTALAGAVGVALFLANLVLALGAREGGPLGALSASNDQGRYWVLTHGLALPAFALGLWRTRRAPEDERRRVALMLAGAAFGATPVALFIVAFAVSPAFAAWSRRPDVHPLLMPVVQLFILSIPGLTAYAVLVDRALEVRVLLRRALQYGLARGLVAAFATAPFGWLGWYLYRRRHDALVDLASGPSGLVAALCLAVGIAVIRLRGRAVAALDRAFFRERYDAQRMLVDFAERARAARSPVELVQRLSAGIEGALHPESIGILVAEPRRGSLLPATPGLRPLEAASELALHLAQRPGALPVDLERPDSPLRNLPEADRQWLADSGAALLVPLPSAEGEPLGLVALGPRRSGQPFSSGDRELLGAVAATVATALENQLLRASSGGGSATPPSEPSGAGWLAQECGGCGLVLPPDAARCERCPGPLEPVPVPYLLQGKYRLQSRLGAGGMGIVYRAIDLSLGRTVAVKALPRTSPEDSMRLRREARAMAALSHEHLATIFAAESWQGTPILILEYLEGGTLADRIGKGPLAPAAVVDLGLALARAIDCIHEAGILHRDIKPSNVAYTADGVPKLLDFGLTRMLAEDSAAPRSDGPLDAGTARTSLVRTDGVVGTPLYLSPEALLGTPPGPAFDLWALAVVLYEALVGAHPFERPTWPASFEAIRAGAPEDPRARVPGCPDVLAALLLAALDPVAAQRPQSARAFAARLRGAA
jgi:GAF domain-containing protein